MKWLKKNKEKDKKSTEAEENWVQTSTDDLFSTKELNEVIKTIEQDRSSEEIVLAKINFETVNKEYYDTVKYLEAELTKKDKLLKTLISKTRVLMDRKNKKLNELIEHVKKLHMIIAYYNKDSKNIDKLHVPQEVYVSTPKIIEEEVQEKEEYIKSKEIWLDDKGEEIIEESDEVEEK